MARIEEILELERLERDIFRGIIAETTLTRTFGGQVAGTGIGVGGTHGRSGLLGSFVARIFPASGKSDGADGFSG